MKRIFLKYIILPVVILCCFMILFPVILFADPAADLANAMEVPSTSSTINGDGQAYDTFSTFGGITPQGGSNFAVISSGIADPNTGNAEDEDFAPPGTANDSTTLSVNYTMPASKYSFTFNFYFVSAEYPEYVGSIYNDTFTAAIYGSSLVSDGTNIAHDTDNNPISVNSVNFAGSGSDLVGTKFEDDGGAGWLTAGASANPSDNILLDFNIQDLGDGIYTSSVILDNFKFGSEQIETGVQIKNTHKSAPPVEIPWVRTGPMVCSHVWINEDNKFQFSFIYPYRDNNLVKIYDMAGNMVYEIDMPYDNPNIIVDLPNGMYTVKTFNDQPEPIQTFVIGK